ncbi:D-alanyl-lipoteichoic acid biosynthesis protein DltD, partial [Bacillus paralicheniformis]|uniref:D-alanyl-lipoteichoic acid biosynthesis protein DltD n=1 Tax=Bacillus paralicheniformis TaxID=1648923 RepID=UPI0020BE40DF
PQWFTEKGMGEFHFSQNYSMLHAYDLAFNQEMDADLRKRAMERLLEFDTVERDQHYQLWAECDPKSGDDARNL